jgi:dTDP-4-dehydrorhamnose reductase
MNEKQRIAELEAKLASIQKDENQGRDPEVFAKAKNLARMSWYDVAFVLEYLGLDETLGQADIEDLKNQLIERKYSSLSGANRGVLSW